MAESPVRVSENVFDFCDLNFIKDIKDYIILLKSIGKADSCGSCVERGNSTKSANKWRAGMTIDHVCYID